MYQENDTYSSTRITINIVHVANIKHAVSQRKKASSLFIRSSLLKEAIEL